MAMKKKTAEQNRPANDDTVIYKVMIALGVLCVAVLGLNMVGRYYGLAGSFDILHTILGWSAIVLGVAAVADLALGLAIGKQHPRFRAIFFPLFIFLLLLAGAAALLHFYWLAPMAFLYFIFVAAAVLYIIALLYQMEFVLLSFLNVCAGAVFYLLSHLYASGTFFSFRALILAVLLALVLVVVCFLAFAARQDGKMKLAHKTVRVFHPRFSPIPLYLTAMVWLICLIASFFLGSVFAYYCMFAVAAWELFFAVYYTFKLS